MSPPPAWAWLQFWKIPGVTLPKRHRSFSSTPMLGETSPDAEGNSTGGGAWQGQSEASSQGGGKGKRSRGGKRIWKVSRLVLALFCVSVLTVQGLVHWAVSDGVERDVRGYELTTDQVARTFAIEVEALGVALNRTTAGNTFSGGSLILPDSLLQDWSEGQAQLSKLLTHLTAAQTGGVKSLQETSSLDGAAFLAVASNFTSLSDVQSASFEYRTALQDLAAKLRARRHADERVLLGLTWLLTLLGWSTVTFLVLGVLRPTLGHLAQSTAENEQVVKEKEEQAAEARRASALMLGYVSHELRNPLNGVMGLIHLCLSVIAAEPRPSARSSRAVSTDYNRDLLGGEFSQGLDSPGKEELANTLRKRSSVGLSGSALLNKSWPIRISSDEYEAGVGNSPYRNGGLMYGGRAHLPPVDCYPQDGQMRGGGSMSGEGCSTCHGLVYDNLSLADKSCELMKTIMGDLIDMQRLEAGQVMMAQSSGTLLDVIRHVTRLAETQHLLNAEAAETAFRVRTHSRRFTREEVPTGDALAQPLSLTGGPDERRNDPPGRKVRGRWEWVQEDGSRIGEGRVGGRAILKYVCDAEVSGSKFEMDRARMEQVLSSLVTNALRSSGPGDPCPVLHARVVAPEGEVRLEVADKGPGLSPDARKKVFQPFLHTYYEEAGLTPGLGLSLYISKLLVTKMMHGSIGFTSEAGFGSTFWVQLPLPKISRPSSSLSFTTASLPNGSSAGNSPRLGPPGNRPGHESTDLSAEELRATPPVRAQPQRTPLLREPPKIEHPVQSPQDQKLSAQRLKEAVRVTARAVSQIEVSARGLILPVINTPTTASSRRELFRSSSVHVPSAAESARAEGDVPETRAHRHPLHPTLLETDEEGGRNSPECASPTEVLPNRDKSKLHCLVVDDVHTNRLVLQKILHVLGHTCDVAVNGAEAVVAVTGRVVSGNGSPRSEGDEKAAATKSYDLILMDVQMPVMDGRRATELIRHWEHQQSTKPRASPEASPEAGRHNLLPIIFVTGNVMPGEEALMLSSGATKVIEKPMRMNDLREIIRVYVDERAPHHLPPLTPNKVFGWTENRPGQVTDSNGH